MQSHNIVPWMRLSDLMDRDRVPRARDAWLEALMPLEQMSNWI